MSDFDDRAAALDAGVANDAPGSESSTGTDPSENMSLAPSADGYPESLAPPSAADAALGPPGTIAAAGADADAANHNADESSDDYVKRVTEGAGPDEQQLEAERKELADATRAPDMSKNCLPEQKAVQGAQNTADLANVDKEMTAANAKLVNGTLTDPKSLFGSMTENFKGGLSGDPMGGQKTLDAAALQRGAAAYSAWGASQKADIQERALGQSKSWLEACQRDAPKDGLSPLDKDQGVARGL